MANIKKINVNGEDYDIHAKSADTVEGLDTKIDEKLSTLSATDMGAIPETDKGIAGGVATLDDKGQLDSSQLPAALYNTVKVQAGTSSQIYEAARSQNTFGVKVSDSRIYCTVKRIDGISYMDLYLRLNGITTTANLFTASVDDKTLVLNSVDGTIKIDNTSYIQ